MKLIVQPLFFPLDPFLNKGVSLAFYMPHWLASFVSKKGIIWQIILNTRSPSDTFPYCSSKGCTDALCHWCYGNKGTKDGLVLPLKYWCLLNEQCHFHKEEFLYNFTSGRLQICLVLSVSDGYLYKAAVSFYMLFYALMQFLLLGLRYESHRRMAL